MASARRAILSSTSLLFSPFLVVISTHATFTLAAIHQDGSRDRNLKGFIVRPQKRQHHEFFSIRRKAQLLHILNQNT